MFVPTGQKLHVDRGAEQGDPLGPMYCGLVLAKIRRDVAERMANEAPHVKFSDLWYMDDGQVFIAPEGVETYLRFLDEALKRVGATRATK